jgi:hypothetical protein
VNFGSAFLKKNVNLGVMSKTSNRSLTSKSTSEEKQLLEQLLAHPELLKCVQDILSLAADSEPTADELEEKLIQEVRRLGLATVESWGAQAEKKAGEQFKESHSKAQ